MGLDLPVTPPPPLTSFTGCKSRTLMSAFLIRRQTDRITLILWACVSMPQDCGMAKLVNVTDDGIEQRLRGLIKIGSNAFPYNFNAKMAALPRRELAHSV